MTQELKHKERLENLQSRLENERERRMEAERDSESLKHEMSVLRENQKGEEKRISDESRFLYAEAFGSINLGIGGSAKSDSEVFKKALLKDLLNDNQFLLGQQGRNQ